MCALEHQVVRTIAENDLLADGCTIVVGASGGPDSTALLHVLTKLKPDCTYIAVYIDHNLRPEESGHEKDLVARLCQQLGIPFILDSVDVKAEAAAGRSLEECARQQRYRSLERIRESIAGDLIAVGHTRDDQAEEILIRLIRGTGLKGLSGMSLKNGRIIRPLLEVSKQEIHAYLHNEHLSYCHDSTNESRAFLRNRVRLELLPHLERDFNPAIRKTLVQTASIFREEERYLAEEAARIHDAVVSTAPFEPGHRPQPCLAIETLHDLHPAIRRRIIERLCWDIGCRPNFQIIEKIQALIVTGKTGTECHLPGGVRVVKRYDSIIFTRVDHTRGSFARGHEQFRTTIRIDREGEYYIDHIDRRLTLYRCQERPDTTAALVVDGESVAFPLLLRAPEPGERFHPLGAPGTKKVSRYLSDKKIPHHLRHLYPVLVAQQRIIAIPGLGIAEQVKIRPESTSFLRITWNFSKEKS